jgi:hypothetical protein
LYIAKRLPSEDQVLTKEMGMVTKAEIEEYRQKADFILDHLRDADLVKAETPDELAEVVARSCAYVSFDPRSIEIGAMQNMVDTMILEALSKHRPGEDQYWPGNYNTDRSFVYSHAESASYDLLQEAGTAEYEAFRQQRRINRIDNVAPSVREKYQERVYQLVEQGVVALKDHKEAQEKKREEYWKRWRESEGVSQISPEPSSPAEERLLARRNMPLRKLNVSSAIREQLDENPLSGKTLEDKVLPEVPEEICEDEVIFSFDETRLRGARTLAHLLQHDGLSAAISGAFERCGYVVNDEQALVGKIRSAIQELGPQGTFHEKKPDRVCPEGFLEGIVEKKSEHTLG